MPEIKTKITLEIDGGKGLQLIDKNMESIKGKLEKMVSFNTKIGDFVHGMKMTNQLKAQAKLLLDTYNQINEKQKITESNAKAITVKAIESRGRLVAEKATISKRYAQDTGMGQGAYASRIKGALASMVDKEINTIHKQLGKFSSDSVVSNEIKKLEQSVNKVLTDKIRQIDKELKSGTVSKSSMSSIRSSFTGDMKGISGRRESFGRGYGYMSSAENISSIYSNKISSMTKGVPGGEAVARNLQNMTKVFMSSVKTAFEAGKLDKAMFTKLKRDFQEGAKTLGNLARDIVRDANRTEKENKRAFNLKMKNAEAESQHLMKQKQMMLSKLSTMSNRIAQNYERLAADASGAQKKAYLTAGSKVKSEIEKLMEVVRSKFPETKSKVAEFIDSINNQVDDVKHGAEMQRKRDPGVQKANFLSSGVLTPIGFALGNEMSKLSDMMKSAVSKTHLGGGITDTISSTLMSAFQASGYMIMDETVRIFGQVSEIILEVLLEPFRLLGSMASGILSLVSTSIISGFIVIGKVAGTSILTGIAAAIGGPWTFVIGAAVVTFLAVSKIVRALVEEMGNFVGNLVRMIMNTITSIIKVAMMTISKIIQGIVGIITSIFNTAFDMVKKGIEGVVEFSKKAFEEIVNLMTSSLEKFAETSYYAAAAFKETVGIAGQSVEKFQGLVYRTMSSYGVSAEQAGKAIFDVVSSGFRSYAKANEIISGATRLAIQSESDLSTSTNALITILQNFKGKGESVKTIVDQLSASTTLGRMTMGEMGNALKSVVGLSSRAGMSLKEMLGSLSMMTRVLGRGSIEESTRYFSRFLEAILMPKDEARKEWEALGVSFEGIGQKGKALEDIVSLMKKMQNIPLENLRKIFSTVQSRRAWLAMTQEAEEFAHLINKDFDLVLKNVGLQFDIMYGTSKKTFERIAMSFEVIKSMIGSVTFNVMKEGLLDFAKVLENVIGQLSSEKGLKGLQKIADFLKPVWDALTKPISNITKMIGDMFKNFNTGGLEKFLNNTNVKKFRNDIIKTINDVYKLIGDVIALFKSEDFTSSWKTIKNYAKQIYGWLFKTDFKTKFNDMVSPFVKMYGIIKDIMSANYKIISLEDTQKVLASLWTMLVSIVTNLMKILMAMLKKEFFNLMAIVGVRIEDMLISALSNAFLFVLKNLPEIASALGTALYKTLGSTVSGAIGIKNGSSINSVRDRIGEVSRRELRRDSVSIKSTDQGYDVDATVKKWGDVIGGMLGGKNPFRMLLTTGTEAVKNKEIKEYSGFNVVQKGMDLSKFADIFKKSGNSSFEPSIRRAVGSGDQKQIDRLNKLIDDMYSAEANNMLKYKGGKSTGTDIRDFVRDMVTKQDELDYADLAKGIDIQDITKTAFEDVKSTIDKEMSEIKEIIKKAYEKAPGVDIRDVLPDAKKPVVNKDILSPEEKEKLESQVLDLEDTKLHENAIKEDEEELKTGKRLRVASGEYEQSMSSEKERELESNIRFSKSRLKRSEDAKKKLSKSAMASAFEDYESGKLTEAELDQKQKEAMAQKHGISVEDQDMLAMSAKERGRGLTDEEHKQRMMLEAEDAKYQEKKRVSSYFKGTNEEEAEDAAKKKAEADAIKAKEIATLKVQEDIRDNTKNANELLKLLILESKFNPLRGAGPFKTVSSGSPESVYAT